MNLLIAGLALFSIIISSISLILGFYNICYLHFYKKNEKRASLTLEQQLKSLIEKKLRENASELREILKEDAASLAQEMITVNETNKQYTDIYKKSSFNTLL